MQDKKLTVAKKVIDALRNHYGENVSQFAKRLGVGASTVSTWASRNSLDADLVFRKCDGVNYDFLVTGEGEMFVTPITGTSKERLSFSEKSVGDVGESPHDQTIRQRLGSYNYTPEVWAMADFLDLMTKNMTAEEREAFARELFEDTVRKLRAGQK